MILTALLALAQAHPARSSEVLLDLSPAGVHAELQLPADQLGMALAGRIDAPPAQADDPALPSYLAVHFGLTDTDGAPFHLAIADLRDEAIDGAAHVIAELELAPRGDADAAAFTLRDDVIVDTVTSHKVLVSVRQDLAHGLVGDAPDTIAVLGHGREALAIDRRGGGWWAGAEAFFALGMRHIAEGYDHLLFLIALLLTVPTASGDAARMAGLRHTARLVTAFTAGHSITLALGGTGLVRLPSAPVELAIAASVLITAVHALRPLFPGREPQVAGAFGLLHGLAFATALNGFGFSGLLTALLGFNLGIEAMQLAVVVLVVPVILQLAPTRAWPALRATTAAMTAVAALGWIVQRA